MDSPSLLQLEGYKSKSLLSRIASKLVKYVSRKKVK